MRPRIVGVIGADELPLEFSHAAELIGREVVARQVLLLPGGLTCTLETASKGAKAAGRLTTGILPELSSRDTNPYIDPSSITGLSGVHNLIHARTAALPVAGGGGSRPLPEIAYARTLDKPSIRYESWQITDNSMPVHKPRDAVARVFGLLDARSFQER